MKQRYNVLGSTPGDGGTVTANSPKEALIKFLASNYGITQKKMQKSLKDTKSWINKWGRLQYGDYEVIEITSHKK